MFPREGLIPPVILKYYLYKATKAVEFYRPIMYIYFLSQGLSFTQIVILEAVYNLTTLLGEIPTGYISDRVGRRPSLLIGTVLITVTLVGIGLANSFAELLVLYVFWSMGYNFRSGSEDAWLYDSLTDLSESERFAHVRGRGEALALAIGAVASVVGGYLAGFDLSYPFFVAAAIMGVGIVVVLSMPEPRSYRVQGSDSLQFTESIHIIRQTVENRSIRAFILYYFILFSAVLYVTSIFLQPVFEEAALEMGVPRGQVEPLLGWFYAVVSLLSAALSYNTGIIHQKIGIKGWFLTVPFAVGLGLSSLWFFPLFAIPVLLFVRAIVETSRSLAIQYINDRSGTTGRASVLSAMAMVSSVTVIPFQLGSGIISDVFTPIIALSLAGIVLIGGSTLLIAVSTPFAPPESAKGTPSK
ncbi:MFS transporter [Natrononativus amylolyticus]|uniref:MFS transporter n=1 Tax=Natrononativus amylolyticus TaxID=2963434 RepID=UPI0020CD6634|nr:MFS transporter [Natrononativus amylolyticus]